MEEFPEFGKIPRFNRDVVVTEKIDGTNGLISIREATWEDTHLGDPNLREGEIWVWKDDRTQGAWIVRAGSRKQWISPQQDNHGFARWVQDNALELVKLGEGNHYGEWYGKGIGKRQYDLDEKRFMLFNTSRWEDDNVRPSCCEVSTVLFEGNMKDLTSTDFAECSCCYNGNRLEEIIDNLRIYGSKHVPGFMKPEGVIIFHKASNYLFKVTLEKDDEWKGKNG